MLKSISVEERWKAAQACLDAFGVEAAGVGRSFLERYLGDYANDELVNSERSFRTETPSGLYEGEGEEGNSPNNVRSTAAALPAVLSPLAGELSSDKKEFPCEWATATQLSSGSFLTITLLDCEDNVATTAASKEQQCHMLTLAVQMAILPAVLIFPCPRCIVQWRGRVLLVAASPICSGEPKRASDHTELAVVMAYLSDAFHLSRYFAPKTPEDTSEEILVAGHPSASTRLGRDGRWYLEGLSNLFPHFPPARGASISARRHMLHLRPEAVMAQGAHDSAPRRCGNHKTIWRGSRGRLELYRAHQRSTPQWD
ncbi:Hypothetical protein, putative [Bodo saltans]|uniref:Uncharacterized protein n=1 Tax=Bodo saltans TaxID=75058 RepID=A0A0S4J460_BODSA|nr:Hypothetical protein, putative [Bodo saltans]|eukprot:CUG74885.1 Hypothetical protein, putative [Bodo saltans]